MWTAANPDRRSSPTPSTTNAQPNTPDTLYTSHTSDEARVGFISGSFCTVYDIKGVCHLVICSITDIIGR